MRTTVTTLVAACALLAACSGESGAPERPRHVLLITVDTLRADHLSMNGYERPTSPNLDAFAADALHYEQAVAVLPKTGPSVTTHLTGRDPCEHGVGSNRILIPAAVPLVAEQFSAAGYRTAAFVSNPVLSPDKGYGRGFDKYFEFSKEGGLDALNKKALFWMGKQEWSTPTFVWLHYIDPHGPYTPPASYLAQYADDAIARADERTLPTTYTPLKGWPLNYVHGAIPSYQLLKDEDRDEDRVAAYVAAYDAELTYMDAAVGEILEFLRERELFEDMGIVFTADHGESLGEHDYWFEHGWYAYEDCQRIPMVVKPAAGPGGSTAVGRRIPVQVSNLDTVPTLLAMAGLASDEGLMGRNLLEPPTTSEPLFIQNTSTYPDSYSGVRVPPYKYLLHAESGGEELYDLSEDPYEAHNLAEQLPDVLTRLRDLHTSLRAACESRSVGESVEVTPDAETLRQLEELGYLGGDDEH